MQIDPLASFVCQTAENSNNSNLKNFENTSEINPLLPEDTLRLHVHHIKGKIIHKVKLSSFAVELVIAETVTKNIRS